MVKWLNASQNSDEYEIVPHTTISLQLPHAPSQQFTAVLGPYTQGQGGSTESSAQPRPSASSQAKEHFPGTDMKTAELCPQAAQLPPMMLWSFAGKAKMV